MISRSSSEYVRSLVAEAAGLQFPKGTEYLLESKLLPFARCFGTESVNEFIRLAQAGQIENPTDVFVEALTDKETSFFRDIYPFEILRRVILPELKAKRSGERKLAIWSAGCATGQEPYSISLLLHEGFADLLSWDLRVTACDISVESLKVAQEGRYNQIEVNRGLALPLLVKYFEKNGLYWQLKPQVREKIEFRPLNLIQDWPELGVFDIILMRNVLAGLAPDFQRDLVDKLLQHLQPDGYLFIGSKEAPEGISASFDEVRIEKAVCYRVKPARAAQLAAARAGGAPADSASNCLDWPKLAQMALRPGAINPAEIIEVCSKDYRLEQRCLAIAAAEPSAQGKTFRKVDEIAPKLRKEQIFLAAASVPATNALVETFLAMTSMELRCVPGAPPEFKNPDLFTGTISYIGNAYGMLSVTLTQDFARRLVSDALGLPPEEATREAITDLLNQFLNLVGVNLKAAFETAHLKWELKSAFVAASGRRKLELPPWAARDEFVLQANKQTVVVEMIVTSLEPAFTSAA